MNECSRALRREPHRIHFTFFLTHSAVGHEEWARKRPKPENLTRRWMPVPGYTVGSVQYTGSPSALAIPLMALPFSKAQSG